MGKRYYCDYCDRSFVDDNKARKKHLQSSSHIRNYKQHYQMHRDLETSIKVELQKEECYKFLNSGFCAFGDSCYRSHFSKHQLHMYQSQYQEKERLRTMYDITHVKTIDSWVRRRTTGIVAFENSSEIESGPVITPYSSNQSNCYAFIPPSLQNLRILKSSDINVAEWG